MDVIGALAKNAVVGFGLALIIGLTVASVKVITVDALLGSGPKMPLIGIRWGLPEFILGGIAGTILTKILWQVYVADLVKRVFNTE